MEDRSFKKPKAVCWTNTVSFIIFITPFLSWCTLFCALLAREFRDFKYSHRCIQGRVIQKLINAKSNRGFNFCCLKVFLKAEVLKNLLLFKGRTKDKENLTENISDKLQNKLKRKSN